MSYTYGYATEKDGVEIAKLLEAVEFTGEISVAYCRRPNAVLSLARDGDRSVFVAVRDTDKKIVGVGACVIKGKQAYLTGMRAVKRVNIPKCYELLREFCTENGAEVTYTTILKDNAKVQRMLERSRPNMPNYLRYGECVVHIIRKNLKIKDDNVLNEDNGLYVLKNAKGETIAQGRTVEQWGYKQYVIKRYGWKLKFAQKFLNWLPNEDDVLKFFTTCDVRYDDENALESFLRHISNIASQSKFFLYGGINAICPVKSIPYRSVMYIVDWEKRLIDTDGIKLKFEIADL